MTAAPATKLDPSRKYCTSCAAVLGVAAETCPSCGARQAVAVERKSKVAAALLAFFLGGIGAHRFYLGQWKLGLLYLLFCWTMIPGLVALVDFIVILATPEEKFQAKYAGKGGGGVVAIVIAVAFGGVFVVGVLAAIAIPNFIRYQLRAKSTEAPVVLRDIDRAEQRRLAAGQGYLPFPHAIPADPRLGAQKLALSAQDLDFARELGWSASPATYGRYHVALASDEAGDASMAACAEMDVDADGRIAATVLYRPALRKDGSVALMPPPAPCEGNVAFADGAALVWREGDPVGVPIRVSGPNEF